MSTVAGNTVAAVSSSSISEQVVPMTSEIHSPSKTIVVNFRTKITAELQRFSSHFVETRSST